MAERFAAMPILCHCRIGQFARSIPGNRKGERKKPRSSVVAGRLHRGVHVGDEFIGGMGDGLVIAEAGKLHLRLTFHNHPECAARILFFSTSSDSHHHAK